MLLILAGSTYTIGKHAQLCNRELGRRHELAVLELTCTYVSECNETVQAGTCERGSRVDGLILTGGNVGACPVLYFHVNRYSHYFSPLLL